MIDHTLTGRNVPITSDVFCVTCGPPGGGGGGTTTGPAIVAFEPVPETLGSFNGLGSRVSVWYLLRANWNDSNNYV